MATLRSRMLIYILCAILGNCDPMTKPGLRGEGGLPEGAFPEVLPPVLGKLGLVLPGELFEASGEDKGTGLLRLGQEARGRVRGPGDGKVDGLHGSRQDIMKGEFAAGTQDPVQFGEEGLLVGYVHGEVLGPDDIEGLVIEGEGEGIGGSDPDFVGEADHFVQGLGGSAEFV